ncbi:Pyridoxamine 5''-phosphate oxidase [Mycobacteroides abscessus]|nr:Pyridoxamine 5''-phosphate oxidase [Mycobacteroides abscessus]
MTNENRPAAVGFHSGELAVQTRAGVRTRAERLAPMAARGQLRTATADFVAAAQLAVLTARDAAGRLWTSPLLGQPGFLRAATPTTSTSPPAAECASTAFSPRLIPAV